jgi:GNAT superfamily N-acetyltransferase
MENEHDWTVRDGDEKDLDQILSLRRGIFGGIEEDKLDPRFWRWEFIENPGGKALIYVIQDKGRIVGHFADIPRDFCIDGETVRGTLSLDLMVEPDYRRKGFFSRMGRVAAGRVSEQGGLFMTAFPIRKETIAGLKKIGWRNVVRLPVLVYPIRFSGIVHRYLRFRPLSLVAGGMARCVYFLFHGRNKRKAPEGISIERVSHPDEQFDRFWEKARTLYPVLGNRDRKALRWRYFEHPTRTYILYRAMKNGEMTGYVVLRKVDLLEMNSAVIVDLLAMEEDVLTALVKKGIEHSRVEGADLLGMMVPESHPYCRSLKRSGFLSSLKAFQFMIFPHGREEILLNPNAWYVNWGDTDVI